MDIYENIFGGFKQTFYIRGMKGTVSQKPSRKTDYCWVVNTPLFKRYVRHHSKERPKVGDKVEIFERLGYKMIRKV